MKYAVCKALKLYSNAFTEFRSLQSKKHTYKKMYQQMLITCYVYEKNCIRIDRSWIFWYPCIKILLIF